MDRAAVPTGGKKDTDTGAYTESCFSAYGSIVPVAGKTERQFTACRADLISLISAEDTRKSEALIDGFLKQKLQNNGLPGKGCLRCG